MKGYAFQILVYDLYPYIKKVSRYFLQRKIIHDKAGLLEFQVKDHLNKCGAVVLTSDL